MVNIKISSYGHGTKVFNLQFSFDTSWHNVENMSQTEVDSLVIPLVKETILAYAHHWEVIDTLIQAGIINEDQIVAWANDNWREEYDN
jgi:hypothetical protein